MVAVYFYFDFRDTNKQRHDNMIRSLLTQLCVQCGGVPHAVRTLYDSCVCGVQQPTIKVLTDTLRHLAEELQQTFVILDALDECTDRQGLLRFIEEIYGWKLGSLHLLVTSRREMDIEYSLDPLIKEQDSISLQSTLVDEDIRVYVHERLQTDPGLKRWRNHADVQKEIEIALMSKAGGMYVRVFPIPTETGSVLIYCVRFRWAACQLDELWKCLNLPMLRKALGSLPKTLDDTYARILNGIDEDYSQCAMAILRFLVYSARPLQIEELAEVVAVDLRSRPQFDVNGRFPEPRDVATICGSLVTIVEELVPVDNSGANSCMDYDSSDEFEQLERIVFGSPGKEESKILVRLAHLSVREYLTSDRILAGPGRAPGYSVRETAANLSIAKTCLAYLLHFDMPELTYPSSKAFPLAGYAARYWIRHASMSGGSEDPDATELLEMEAELLLSKPDASRNWGRLFLWSFCSNAIAIEVSGYENASPLCIASYSGRVETVQLLIQAGANVNARSCYPYRGTPLQAASRAGHYQIVLTLLNAGAEVNAPGDFVDNALMSASRMGRNEIVQLLLAAGAEPRISIGGTCPLWLATYGGDCHTIYSLIDHGADVNWCDRNGDSLLRLARRYQKVENARVLEENGAIDYGKDYSETEWEKSLFMF